MRLTILIILLSVGILFSQNLTFDVNKDFEQAVKLYNAKNYETALGVFQRVIKAPQPNDKITASAFFISKIYLTTKKYAELEKYTKEFLLNFPNSKYANEFRVNLLKGYIDQNEFKKAFNKSLEFLAASSSISFSNEIKTTAEKLALNYLNSSDVAEQIELYNKTSLKPYLLLIAAKLSRAEGNEVKFNQYLDEIINNYRSSDEYQEALNLKRSSLETNKTNIPLVAVLMSLTDQNGRSIESVKEILEGIKYAFHEFNFEREDKIGLVISDLERDDSKIITETNSVLENDAIRCILGPVFSDDVRKVLNEVDNSSICVISPTATDDDLVSISENFYQANPSFEARGKTFAQYLYFVENKKNLAILNSIDSYSPLLAASFAKEFERLGGKILIKETYKTGSQSLTEQMSRISSFANEIDGIYAPISDRNDAMIILSQMVQRGLSTKIYGNQDWFIAKGFETSPELSNNLIFESDYFLDFNDLDLKNFSSQFKKLSGIDVNRNVLYGYDLAKYLLTVMRNINPTRKNIKYKIESGISVTGYHNNISFNEDRVNKFINVIRFKDGIFELVDKFKSGN
jgi:branched-chain amino acid transport system substrate-binding protein